MQGNYLVLKRGNSSVPYILPPEMEHKDALQAFKLNLKDVVSAGTFTYDPHFSLGGFSFRCTTVNIGQEGGARLFGRGDQDACILRDSFQRRN